MAENIIGIISSSTLTNIADAIRSKNGSTDKYKPAEMADAIRNLVIDSGGINTNDATATASDMLSGKTAYASGTKVTGTIQSKGAETYTPSATDQIIPSGIYLGGAQTIKGVSVDNIPSSLLESKTVTAPYTGSTTVNPSAGKVLTAVTIVSANTSDATATASEMLSGKTAYVKGVKVTGNIQTKSAVVETINPGESKDVPVGYYPTKSTITASLADTEGEIDASLKASGSALTINPTASVTIKGGKYYTSDTTVTANKATTVAQVDDSLKQAGSAVTINPGENKTIASNKLYTGATTVTASLADTEDEIASSLKQAGSAVTINPGESKTVNGGKYYTSNTTVTASLADTASEIASSLKQAGSAVTINPGESKTVNGNKFYTSNTTVTASLADTESEIDTSLKASGSALTINPTESITINSGKYYTSNTTVTANKATTLAQIDSSMLETKTAQAPIMGSIQVTPTDGKVLTAVTVTASDTTGTATENDIVKGKTAIVNGVKITGVTDVANYYVGATEPSDSFGEDGDIYFMTETLDDSQVVGNVSATGNGVITLNDTLPTDTYTLYYEDEDNSKLDNWGPITTITL